MVLQVLADAGRMLHDVDAVPLQVCAALPMPDSISRCGDWNAPAETMTSPLARTDSRLAVAAELDADRALAVEQDFRAPAPR